MSERIGDDDAASLLLEVVVADGVCAAEGFLDVARFERLEFLLSVIGPDAGEEIGLKLEANGELVPLALAGAAASSVDLVGDAEDFLHVVADFVGDDVGLGEVAGCAEAVLQFAIEVEVKVNTFIFGAVKGTDCGAVRPQAESTRPVNKTSFGLR